MKSFCAFILLFSSSLYLIAQEPNDQGPLLDVNDEQQYDSDLLPASFHKSRRDSLRKLLPQGGLAIFFSSPIRNRSNDVDYEYHQDPNIYYLTGLREPNSAIIISKENFSINGDSINELLFMQDKDPARELWEGKRLGVEQASTKLGIQSVESNQSLGTLEGLLSDKKIFYIEPQGMELSDSSDSQQLFGLFAQISEMMPPRMEYAEKHLEMMMAKLRQIKSPEEIVLLRKAIDITCEAQIELMRSLSSNMHEYQTEAIIEYVFKSNGAEYPGFPSIQGSGENSCILHYTSNRKALKAAELLVSDVGAEYHGYTADVTRTIPVDGSFSKEEKAIYELVLKAQMTAIDSALVGKSFFLPHITARDIIADGLMKLGIIKKAKDYDLYFMHGSSHYLGLDVHDAGLFMELEEGNVITVEPGIYIAEGSDCDEKWWNIGVRIEDDVLIKKSGPEVLSVKAPKSIENIENLMKESGQFEKEKILEKK